jgi:Ca-activated chloride channel family protein
VLIDSLRSDDRVALVRYASSAELLLAPTNDRAALRAAIAQLEPGGSTNLQAGLQIGYQAAERAFRREGINRVILLSDGIANVGDTEALPILRSVADWATRGVELTTVGVGMGHNDPLLERLADRGDGRYAYVDTLEEAQRLFGAQLSGTLQTIARDARVQVTFDPNQVAGYRLIGYDNRALPDEVFRNDAVDAGEIGAGHRVTVLYEVEMRTDSTRRSRRPAIALDLRYRSERSGTFEEMRQEVLGSDLTARPVASRSSAAFDLSVTLAQFAEELQNQFPSPGVLRSLSERTRGLAESFDEGGSVFEAASLMAQAAALAAQR